MTGRMKKLLGGSTRIGQPARWLTAVATTLLAVPVVSVVGAAPAQAVPGVNYVRNWATGLCLDSNGSSVYTRPCTMPVLSNWWQSWVPEFMGHEDFDSIRLANAQTGGCLASGGGSVYNTACLVYPRSGEEWLAVGESYDQVSFVDQSGRCLDSNGAGEVYLLPCNGGGYQKWKVGF